MTDTTQAKSGFKIVYWSNTDHPFAPVLVPSDFKLTEATFPLVPTAPDASIKLPKYDWQNFRWIENESTELGQQVAQINESLQSFSAALKQTQEQTQQVASANDQTQKSLSNFSKMLVQMNQNSGKTTAMVAQLVQAFNKAQAADSKPATPTDKSTTEDKKEGTN